MNSANGNPLSGSSSDRKNFAAFSALIMLMASFAIIVPGVMAGSAGTGDADVTTGAAKDGPDVPNAAVASTVFTYPAGSTAVAMPGNQSALELRQGYKYMFQKVYSDDDVEWAATSFGIDGAQYPAGSFMSRSNMSGGFNVTQAQAPFNISQAYSLHPVKIAVLAANTTDIFGQVVTWEEGYFERFFKTYLWGDYFDTVSEGDIKNGTLTDYDVLILPAVTTGYISTLELALGPTGLGKISTFVNGGGMLYAQGDSCHVAQASALVPTGTVNTSSRVGDAGAGVNITIQDANSSLSWGWQTNEMYVLDDPLLNPTDASAVVATYASGLQNNSQIGSPAIMHFTPGSGDVVLVGGHPSDKGAQYPILFDALFTAMAERGDIRGSIQQHYSDAVDDDIIPAQELNVSATVTTEFHNFWNSTISSVMLVEDVSSIFAVNVSSISPSPTLVQNTSAGTKISWTFQATQGTHTFTYDVLTFENTTKKGTVLVSNCTAGYTDPVSSRYTQIDRESVYVHASLAARLNGDRDIELDGCYPLPAGGFYYDIALPLENKEDTMADNITITDIVCLRSPIVDVTNQTILALAWNNTNNGTNNSVWVTNEIFYYLDDYGQPLYPLPDMVENTTYNYTCENNDTTFQLPAVRLTWNYSSLQGYDYQEPAIRYGIFTQEEFNRTVSFISDPVQGSVIMNNSGGSVYTNIGIHPVPYHEYLSNGTVSIPQAAGGELSRVEWKDIWERDHDFNLRTVFYDIVPFPPPEEHAVVTTTFEMTVNGERVKEFPIYDEAQVHYVLRTWNGYGVYNASSYPYYMNLTKNETMIVQSIPRGVGYDLNYTGFEAGVNTSLLKIHNTSTHTIVYYQQFIAGGAKERVDMYANLTTYPEVHREGDFKVNDGARFVYHQIAVGPSRYEVFDSHVQAVFGIGNDLQVSKITAPAFISTYGDQLYHFIKVEDPYEPREFTDDPYIASYGFGEMAATTYVGGRQQDTLYHARLDPGEKTLCRIEVDNNLGVDLLNVSMVPVVPDGWKVTPDNFTEGIPPIFYDFPFINRSEIWDAWKSVWYFWIEAPEDNVTLGRTYEIPFELWVNGSNASYVPSDFMVPSAVVGVKDVTGYVSAVYGRATQLDITDVMPSYVGVSDVRLCNATGAADLEANLATTAANPKLQDESAVNASYYGLTQVNYTVNGTLVDVDLPEYAQTIPWLEDGVEHQTLYVIIKSNLTKTSGGVYLSNNGPQGSYKDHFNRTNNVTGNPYTVACHGPSVSPFPPGILSVTAPGVPGPAFFLTRTLNNTVVLRLTARNDGDGIAEDCVAKYRLDPDVSIDAVNLPSGVTYDDGMIYWSLGDVAPGSGAQTAITIWATPPPQSGQNPGPPDSYRLIEYCQNEFVHSFLGTTIETAQSGPLNAGLFAYDLNLIELQMEHQFAAVGYPMDLEAQVSSDWKFSGTVSSVRVNFTVDDTYVDHDTIDTLAPKETKSATGTHTFTSEDSYTLKAEIVGPELEEYYDNNNDRQLVVGAYTPYTAFTEPDQIMSQDTYAASGGPAATHHGENTMRVGRSAVDGYMRPYLAFDLDGIPDSALVVDAELKLYLVSGGGFSASVHRVTGPWTEDGISWSARPSYHPTAVDTTSLGSPGGYRSWDVTGLVKSWVEGAEPNYGVCVRAQSESVYQTADLYSADCDAEYYRPALLITFADPWQAPGVPANFAGDDPDGDRVRLSWDHSEQGLDYKIYKASVSGGPYNLLGSTFVLMSPHGGDGRVDNYFYDDLEGGDPTTPTGLASTHIQGPGTIAVSWSPSTVPPSPTFYYRIQASNSEGNSNLPSSPVAAGQVTPDIEAYEVYRSASPSGPWDKIAETDTPSYTDGGLGDNATWYYRLRARSTEGNASGFSAPVMGRSNAPPAASGLALGPGPRPATTAAVTASWSYSDWNGDAESGTVLQWHLNGAHAAQHDGVNPLPASATSDGDVWHFTVTPKDGIGFGSPVDSGTVTVNTRPTATDVGILPGEPETDDELTLTYVYADADSDAQSGTTLQWYRDDLHQAAYDGKLTVPAAATSRGDVWHVRVVPHDGIEPGTLQISQGVTVGNKAPALTDLTIIPAEPRTGDRLEFTYQYHDQDGDALHALKVTWYRNGVALGSQTGLTLPSSATTRGDSIQVTVSPSDGMSYGAVAGSQVVSVINTEPAATELSITGSPAPASADITGSYVYGDDDGDAQGSTEIHWYRNGLQVTDLNDQLTVPAHMTGGGDSWYFTLRPGDGETLGELVTSPTAAVNNPPKVADASVSPDPATSSDELTLTFGFYDADGHAWISSSVAWYRDGEHMWEFDDALTIPAGMTQRCEMWVAIATVFDGYDVSAEARLQVLVGNTPPTVSDVRISPVEPRSTQTLEVSYDFTDDEGDAESGTTIAWYRDGGEVEELGGERTVPPSHTSRSERWHCEVTPGDGASLGLPVTSPAVTIRNGEPSVSGVEISPGEPGTGDTLTLDYDFRDPDGDHESGTTIIWHRNGQSVGHLRDLLEVPPGETVRGQEWYAAVAPSDGETSGEGVSSPAVTIGNTLPEATELSIGPVRPLAGGTMEASYTFHDADNDAESGSDLRWYRDGAHVKDYDGMTSLPAGSLREGDVWHFTVAPSDGVGTSGAVESAAVTVNHRPALTMLAITPAEPVAGEPLTLAYEYTDADGDPEDGTSISWYRNGERMPGLKDRTEVDGSYVEDGDRWTAIVKPGDGLEEGDGAEAAGVTVVASVSGTAGEAGSSSSGAYGGLIAAVAAILILLLAFFIVRRRKKGSGDVYFEEDLPEFIPDEPEMEGLEEGDGLAPVYPVGDTFTPDPVSCPMCREENDGDEATCFACGFPVGADIEVEQGCPHCGAAFPLSELTSPDCPSCGGDLGVMVDGVGGDGPIPPEGGGGTIGLDGSVSGEMECPSCRSYVSLSSLRSQECPMCGSGLGVAVTSHRPEGTGAEEKDARTMPDLEAAEGMDDDWDDWSAPTERLGDDSDDDWDDGEVELGGETVEGLLKEEAELDELFDVE